MIKDSFKLWLLTIKVRLSLVKLGAVRVRKRMTFWLSMGTCENRYDVVEEYVVIVLDIENFISANSIGITISSLDPLELKVWSMMVSLMVFVVLTSILLG